MFGFEHYNGEFFLVLLKIVLIYDFLILGILSDIVTFAKGITGAFYSMSGVGVRDHVFNFFCKKNLWGCPSWSLCCSL